MKPEYGEQMVTAIVTNNTFSWYVLERDFCDLDYPKMLAAIREKGYEVAWDESYRFGIAILNEHTKDEFLKNVADCKTDAETLHAQMLAETDREEQLAYCPTIYINFDTREFISYYPEPEAFEARIPDGWRGSYRWFEDMIPKNERYWLDENGKDILEEDIYE